ncbi:hypothetical protein RRG08_009755 [Elysia crispata]|uniref:Uncharacterized protein n=1 Tax=Elysia crispata TaxID=231223 RepID=A0AAE1D6U1_9GAST|nr:hypothetical protein RRG08_009755 [Elysia crispata]
MCKENCEQERIVRALSWELEKCSSSSSGTMGSMTAGTAGVRTGSKTAAAAVGVNEAQIEEGLHVMARLCRRGHIDHTVWVNFDTRRAVSSDEVRPRNRLGTASSHSRRGDESEYLRETGRGDKVSIGFQTPPLTLSDIPGARLARPDPYRDAHRAMRQ